MSLGRMDEIRPVLLRQYQTGLQGLFLHLLTAEARRLGFHRCQVRQNLSTVRQEASADR